MKIAIENSVVGIEYEVKEAGTNDVLDSNKDTNQPLEFITGKGHIIPGLEKALEGMVVGDKGDMLITAADAYGEYSAEAIKVLPIEQFEGVELKEGLTLYGQGDEGQTVQVTVKSFDEKEVNVDFNHPLAGKDLMFSVSVLKVREATADEATSGQIAGGHSHGNGECCGGGHCSS